MIELVKAEGIRQNVVREWNDDDIQDEATASQIHIYKNDVTELIRNTTKKNFEKSRLKQLTWTTIIENCYKAGKVIPGRTRRRRTRT